jgi:hypothetical protein
VATTYDTIPTLSERILGADLIMIGTVIRLVETRQSQFSDAPRSFGIFEVTVEEVLKGRRPGRRLLVGTLSAAGQDQTAWLASLHEDARMLFLLVPDVGPSLPERLFAPYFASAFELDGRNTFSLPREALDSESRKLLRATGRRFSLTAFRRLVDHAVSAQERDRTEVEELLPPGMARRPYAPVTESPLQTPYPEGPSAPGLSPADDAAGGRHAEIVEPDSPLKNDRTRSS